MHDRIDNVYHIAFGLPGFYQTNDCKEYRHGLAHV